MSEIEKVLVALDNTDEDVIKAAVQLAAALGADLHGLFVEDIDVIRVSQLPAITELRIYSIQPDPLDDRRVIRRLRARARRVEQILRAEAERAQVNWQYDIRRGKVHAEIARATPEADLIVISTGPGRSLAETTERVLEQSQSPLLLLDQPLPDHPNIITMYDGGELAGDALELATAIAQATEGFLTVMTVAENSTEGMAACQTLAFTWLAEHDVQAQCRWLMQSNPVAVVHALYEEEADLFVTPASMLSFNHKALMETINSAAIATLVVR